MGSSSLTRIWTWVSCTRSSESKPQDHQGSPLCITLYPFSVPLYVPSIPAIARNVIYAEPSFRSAGGNVAVMRDMLLKSNILGSDLSSASSQCDINQVISLLWASLSLFEKEGKKWDLVAEALWELSKVMHRKWLAQGNGLSNIIQWLYDWMNTSRICFLNCSNFFIVCSSSVPRDSPTITLELPERVTSSKFLLPTEGSSHVENFQ